MKRRDIVNGLIARGYKAEEKETVKNGVIFEGIVICSDDKIAPVIYTQGLIDEAEKRGMDLTEVVSQVIRIYEDNKRPDVDLEALMSREHILSNIRIALQKESDQDLVKKESGFEGIEKYLYIHGETKGSEYSVKVNDKYLAHAQVGIEEAWEQAERNTFECTMIRSMSSILSEMSGEEIEEEENAAMYIITNRNMCRGASAILDMKSIRAFFKPKNISKLIVLPSSIHEMILVPAESALGIEELSNMVKEINEEQVAPEERLTDMAYEITI